MANIAFIGLGNMGGPGSDGSPVRQGFDFWFGYLDQGDAHNYFPEYLYRNEEQIPLPGNVGGKRGQYSNDLMTDEILEFLRANRTRPFFVYLAYTIPHSLLEVPDDSLAEYAGAFDELGHPALVARDDRGARSRSGPASLATA